MRRSWSDGKRLGKYEDGYDWLYSTKRWKLRRLHQLRKHPLCAACQQDNVVKAATVAHHVIDHHGDYKIFFSSPLQSLCKSCHDNIREGSHVLSCQRGCDINGKPYRTNPIYIDNNKAKAGGRKRLDINAFKQRRTVLHALNYAFVPRLAQLGGPRGHEGTTRQPPV
jgi:5-methylcytosine-specific restriction protein A